MMIIKIIYPGAFRINTVTAVRATSAAPTFFTPVQWEQGMYCTVLYCTVMEYINIFSYH